MLQPNVFTRYFKGLNFDIDPKVIIKPKGIENSNVFKNSSQFSKKPASNSTVTC